MTKGKKTTAKKASKAGSKKAVAVTKANAKKAAAAAAQRGAVTKAAASKKAVAVTNGKRKLSALDAAAAVLAGAAEPMNCQALVTEMIARKLWASPAGLTPAATLSAAIGREIAAKGKAARFVKTAPGMFKASPAAKA